MVQVAVGGQIQTVPTAWLDNSQHQLTSPLLGPEGPTSMPLGQTQLLMQQSQVNSPHLNNQMTQPPEEDPPLELESEVVKNVGKHWKANTTSIPKEWDKYTPVGNKLPMWHTDLASHTFKEDYEEFAAAVSNHPTKKILVKLWMCDPDQKKNNQEVAQQQEDNLTFNYGNEPKQLRLKAKKARELAKPKANKSKDPVTSLITDLMAHISARFGRDEKQLWIENPEENTKSMHINNN
ncbi:hypothetical protein PGTUg99_007452 [Puccinia graminis f. sp. tritici]|uniref:Uncharacterized protein n=1 Tax=Puccinia graminis f. sp. tritici TaxID=56615 RepID=A0A5B0Q1B6_PUCGR|nr:hypothetical protein PGTUg99_007452 [Puccinia graminis f. sp. tritici]